MSSLDREARRQSARDASAKLNYGRSGKRALLDWYLARSFETKLVLPMIVVISAVVGVHYALQSAGFSGFSIFSDTSELDTRPPPTADAKGKLAWIENQLFAELGKIAAGDLSRAEQADDLAGQYSRHHYSVIQAITKSTEAQESQVAKQERENRERENRNRAWSQFNSLMDDRKKEDAEIVDFIKRHMTEISSGSIQQYTRLFIQRARKRADEKRQMVLLEGEVGKLLIDLARTTGSEGSRIRSGIDERLYTYYKLRAIYWLPIRGDGEPALDAVEVMAAASAIRVIMRNLGTTDKGRISSAVSRVRKDANLQSVDVASKAPLFSEMPDIQEVTFMSGSEQERKENLLRHKRSNFREAIKVLYYDCAEEHRLRYLGFLKELVGQFIGLGQIVSHIPPNTYYPELSLADDRPSGDRLNAATIIMLRGQFTVDTVGKLRRFPDALLGKACPPDRQRYRGPTGGAFEAQCQQGDLKACRW